MKIAIKIVVIAALLTGVYYGFTLYKDKLIPEKKTTNTVTVFDNEVEQIVTKFWETISKGDIDGVYAMTTEAVKINIPREEFSHFITTFFDQRKFKAQRNTGYSYSDRYPEIWKDFL